MTTTTTFGPARLPAKQSFADLCGIRLRLQEIHGVRAICRRVQLAAQFEARVARRGRLKGRELGGHRKLLARRVARRHHERRTEVLAAVGGAEPSILELVSGGGAEAPDDDGKDVEGGGASAELVLEGSGGGGGQRRARLERHALQDGGEGRDGRHEQVVDQLRR